MARPVFSGGAVGPMAWAVMRTSGTARDRRVATPSGPAIAAICPVSALVTGDAADPALFPASGLAALPGDRRGGQVIAPAIVAHGLFERLLPFASAPALLGRSLSCAGIDSVLGGWRRVACRRAGAA